MAIIKLTKKNSKSVKRNTVRRNLKGGAGEKEDYVFISPQVSTQQNADINYREVGIIHITESGAVNALTGLATGVVNMFGKAGFDNSIYDKARNKALKKLMSQVSENQKIYNLRMEVVNESESRLFFIHLYGTLLQKKL